MHSKGGTLCWAQLRFQCRPTSYVDAGAVKRACISVHVLSSRAPKPCLPIAPPPPPPKPGPLGPKDTRCPQLSSRRASESDPISYKLTLTQHNALAIPNQSGNHLASRTCRTVNPRHRVTSRSKLCERTLPAQSSTPMLTPITFPCPRPCVQSSPLHPRCPTPLCPKDTRCTPAPSRRPRSVST
jgi:hypothetical protein